MSSMPGCGLIWSFMLAPEVRHHLAFPARQGQSLPRKPARVHL
jgi:hypothetical protein